VLALAFAACSHRSYVANEPTPFVVKQAGDADAGQKADAVAAQNAHAPVANDELSRTGKACNTDKDCAGRLRCVSYRGVAGRELRQCLFSCLDGCPDGWTCQMRMADGPDNTCQQAVQSQRR
jgi:hypothetical protein